MGKASQKYIKNNLEQVVFRVEKGKREIYAEAAANAGMSFKKFVTEAMHAKIKAEKLLSEGKQRLLFRDDEE